MAEDRILSYGGTLPATWLAAIQEFIGTGAANFELSLASNNTIQVIAGTLSAQVTIGIDGLFRYITATINAAVTGSAGQYDIFVTTGPNSYTAGTGGAGETDNTNYAFALSVLAAGTTPTKTASLTNYRRVGQLDFDGTNVTHLRQFFGDGDTTSPIMPTSDTTTEIALRVIGLASQTASLQTWEDPVGTVLAKVPPATVASGDSSTNLATTQWVQALMAAYELRQAPVGTIAPYSGQGDPGNGWVIADGRLISSATYPAFDATCGTSAATQSVHRYNGGVNPGSGNVKIPDKRGKKSIGAINMYSSAGAGSNDNSHVQTALGASSGEVAHTLAVAETPSHSHGDNGHYHNFPANLLGSGYSWTATLVIPNGSSGSVFIGYVGGNSIGNYGNDNYGYASIAATGGGGSHNNVDPSEADAYIVRIY